MYEAQKICVRASGRCLGRLNLLNHTSECLRVNIFHVNHFNKLLDCLKIFNFYQVVLWQTSSIRALKQTYPDCVHGHGYGYAKRHLELQTAYDDDDDEIMNSVLDFY